MTQTLTFPAPTREVPVGLGVRRRPGADAAVACDGVRVVYANGVRALDGLSLSVPRGQHLAVLGPSGGGKTTLLRCLSGRLPRDCERGGSVAVVGERVVTIHQDLRLVQERSALCNVLDGCACRVPLWRTLAKFPRGEKERARALLRRVGLGGRMRTPVRHLSGGEKQRVAIARALMQDPAVLLADEPVAALDEANAESVMRLLDRLRREDELTLVSVLHDRDLARRHADRAVGIEGGRLVHDGPAGTLPDAINCGCDDACDEPVNCERGQNAPRVPSATPSGLRRAMFALLAVGLLAGFAWSLWDLWPGERDRANALPATLRMLGDLVPAWGDWASLPWSRLLGELAATLEMALVGTAVAVVIAWPLSALAARNVGPPVIWRGVRTGLNALRAVPSLVWALLFIAPLGMTPAAGVAALVVYSLGYLTKFFYEAFEDVDPRPPGALAELGAGGLWRFGRAVWPASRPAVVAASLFMLEYNVRAASVLGVVGAGGIGQSLKYYAEFNRFEVVGVIILMLVAVVLALDAVSRHVRRRLVEA